MSFRPLLIKSSHFKWAKLTNERISKVCVGENEKLVDFQSPGSDTYIVFGEAKIEDLSQHAQMSAIDRIKPAKVRAFLTTGLTRI